MKTYFVKQKFRLGGERFDIKVELPIRLKGPFLRFQRPLRFLVRTVVRLVISPRSRLVSCLSLQ